MYTQVSQLRFMTLCRAQFESYERKHLNIISSNGIWNFCSFALLNEQKVDIFTRKQTDPITFSVWLEKSGKVGQRWKGWVKGYFSQQKLTYIFMSYENGFLSLCEWLTLYTITPIDRSTYYVI